MQVDLHRLKEKKNKTNSWVEHVEGKYTRIRDEYVRSIARIKGRMQNNRNVNKDL